VVADEFVSFNIDAGDMFGDSGFAWNSSKLVKLATNLSPGMLRIGGSDQERFKYDAAFFNTTWPSVIGLIRQLKAGGVGTIFGLNPDLTEVAALISRPDAGEVWGWEFGNEPSQDGGAPAGAKLGKQFAALRTMLDGRFGRGAAKLLGPDVAFPAWAEVPSPGSTAEAFTRAFFAEAGPSVLDSAVFHIYPYDHNDVGGDEGAAAPAADGAGTEREYSREARRVVGDPVCKSEAGAEGWCNYTRVLWSGPGELPDTTAMQTFAFPFQALAHAANVTDVRVGETASVNHGGWPNVSNAYVSGFWSMNQLGWLAQGGFTAMQRQTLACGPKYRNGGGVYGLLSEAPAYTPRPDYWSSALWARLMGPRVLGTSVVFTAGGAQPAPPFATPSGLERTLRAYAHCTPTATATATAGGGGGGGGSAGAVTVAFVNPQTYAIDVNLTGLSGPTGLLPGLAGGAPLAREE
jgi:hypothetical protein